VAPGAAQAALQALVFKSTTGMNATTTFTVSINDGSVIVSNNATTVVSATPSSTTALSVAFSADTGISNTDLITKTAAQTISGTLSAALASTESVQVSLDNGATWTTATASTAAPVAARRPDADRRRHPAGACDQRRRQQHAVDRQLRAGHHRANHTGASVAFSADTGASSTDLITKTQPRPSAAR
jgi:hypothetical protein